MDITLDSSVQYLPRVGPQKTKLLAKLDIHTVRDLLFYPPFRYNDFSSVSPIRGITPGITVTLTGIVRSHKTFLTKNGKRMQNAVIEDNTGKIDIIWFNQPYLTTIVKPGMTVNVAGKADWFGKKLAMISPDYEIQSGDDTDVSLHTGRIVPVYSETEGITSKWLRGRIMYCLSLGLADIPEILPENIITNFHLSNYSDSIKTIHFPKTPDDAMNAKRRLAFDELLMLFLTAKQMRRIWEQTRKSASITWNGKRIDKCIVSLPFTLTDDQKNVLEDIRTDFGKIYPMNRILEGDVGSGKTIVAAISMYAVHMSGKQSLLMAPTQILAEQHYNSLQNILEPLGVPVRLITGNTKKRDDFQKRGIIVGTHALLSHPLPLADTGLIVIDEQQRFGVAQRELLRSEHTETTTPHLLTMTATPIPRTIALSIFGNLDLSVLRSQPTGRIPVKTWVVPEKKREGAYDWIRNEIHSRNLQVFIICPLIDESENLTSLKAVKSEYERLRMSVFSDMRIALLHGRLIPKDKTDILADFRNHKYDILVATPVVEVGIDIPDAGVIIIEGSERFGLSQLHQLRGRVGRRDKQGYCLLFTNSDDEVSIKRLKAMETLNNGLELAEIDLSIRGPGELFGTKQHGMPKLVFGTLLDEEILRDVRIASDMITSQSPDLQLFPLLKDRINEGTIHGMRNE